MGKNYWVGEKVRLRPLALSDVDAPYYQITPGYDSQAEQLGDALAFPLSPQQMKSVIEEAVQKKQEGDEFWFVIEENQKGEVVGNLFTFSCNRRMGTFRYGMDIASPHQRKGYGSEALLMVLRFFFAELRYQKVTAGVYAFNRPSLQFHRQLGFQEEGRLRRMVFTQGQYDDEIFLGLLQEEFWALHGREGPGFFRIGEKGNSMKGPSLSC